MNEDKRTPAIWHREPVPGVKKIIAVASGKGGVGKSATAVNLAYALTQAGQRVGLLDADIYGPSLPRMLGLMGAGQPELRDNLMVPFVAHGMQCMSVQFIIGSQAAILRGPMVTKMLRQLLRATKWDNPRSSSDVSAEALAKAEAVAPLDILFVDMPPGTGDIHLSLAQAAPLDGAIIVTTPQDVAVLDARKCLQMFLKVNVPIVGVIENMSGGVFGSGGGERLAKEFSVPFLGAIPLDAEICKAGEAGEPGPVEMYAGIAQKLSDFKVQSAI